MALQEVCLLPNPQLPRGRGAAAAQNELRGLAAAEAAPVVTLWEVLPSLRGPAHVKTEALEELSSAPGR